VARAGMRKVGTQNGAYNDAYNPHTHLLEPCTPNLSVSSSQPITIRMNKPTTFTGSDDTVNIFQILRDPSVTDLSFTMRVTDSTLVGGVGGGQKVIVGQQTFRMGSSIGGRRLLKTRSSSGRKTLKRGRHAPSKQENSGSLPHEVPHSWPKRKLLKGSWGGGSRRGGGYSGRRRYSSRRRYYRFSAGYVSRRRRFYARYYSGGTPIYYNGLAYTSITYRGQYGMVQQRLGGEYTSYKSDSSYGFTGTSKRYVMGTSHSVSAQSYNSNECSSSCSSSTSCAGAQACTCSSCISVKASYKLKSTMTLDMLMKTGFVPTEAKWPLYITISGLQYRKSYGYGAGSSSAAGNAPVSTDLMLTYGEADTQANAAPSTLTPSCIVLAVSILVAIGLMQA